MQQSRTPANHERGLRALAVVVLAMIGAILAPSPHDQGLLRRSPSVIAESLAIGAALTLVALALIGSALFVARRRRQNRAKWATIASGPIALGLTLTLLLVGAGIRLAANDLSARRSASGAHASQVGLARQWSTQMTPIIVELKRPWLKARTFERHLPLAVRRPGAGTEAAQLGADLARTLRRLRALPRSPVRRLDAATSSLERLVALKQHAYRLLSLTLEASSASGSLTAQELAHRPSFRRAQTLNRRANALSRSFGRRLFGLNRLFYGD